MKIVVLALGLLSFAYASAHSGRTDSSGCHNDRKNGGYHCHNRDSSESLVASLKSAVNKPESSNIPEPMEGIVIRTKGQESTIIIPKGRTLQPGDKVYFENTQLVDTTQKEPSIEVQEEETVALRRHSVRFDLSIESVKGDGEKYSSSNFLLGYSYNIGYIEPFVNVVNASADYGTYQESAFGLGGGLEVNFIENKVGQFFVPYVSVGASHLEGEVDSSDGLSDYNTEVESFVLGLGAKIFVTNSIALKVGYYTANQKIDYKQDGEVVSDSSRRVNQFLCGFSFYF